MAWLMALNQRFLMIAALVRVMLHVRVCSQSSSEWWQRFCVSVQSIPQNTTVTETIAPAGRPALEPWQQHGEGSGHLHSPQGRPETTASRRVSLCLHDNQGWSAGQNGRQLSRQENRGVLGAKWLSVLAGGRGAGGGGGRKKEREKRIDYGGGVNFHFIMSQRRCTYYHSAHTGTEEGRSEQAGGGGAFTGRIQRKSNDWRPDP